MLVWKFLLRGVFTCKLRDSESIRVYVRWYVSKRNIVSADSRSQLTLYILIFH